MKNFKGRLKLRIAQAIALFIYFRFHSKFHLRDYGTGWLWKRIEWRVHYLKEIGADYDVLCAATLMDFNNLGLIDDDYIEYVLGDRVWDLLFNAIHGYKCSPDDYNIVLADVAAQVRWMPFSNDKAFSKNVLEELGRKFIDLRGGNEKLYLEVLNLWQREFHHFASNPHGRLFKEPTS